MFMHQAGIPDAVRATPNIRCQHCCLWREALTCRPPQTSGPAGQTPPAPALGHPSRAPCARSMPSPPASPARGVRASQQLWFAEARDGGWAERGSWPGLPVRAPIVPTAAAQLLPVHAPGVWHDRCACPRPRSAHLPRACGPCGRPTASQSRAASCVGDWGDRQAGRFPWGVWSEKGGCQGTGGGGGHVGPPQQHK